MVSLEVIDTGNQCRMKWDQMDGTPHVRYCERCKCNVFRTEGLTDEQAVALVAKYEEGHTRTLHRRPDGTLVTAECRGESAFGMTGHAATAIAAVGCALALISVAAAEWRP